MKTRLTRRALFGMAAGWGAAGLAGRLGASTPPLFEKIPPSASGITWVHDNAMSDDRYLPETMGPGCAFFDYDNDGRPDVFVGNNGEAQVLLKNNGGSYLSSHDPREVIRLGQATKLDWLEIKWPAPSGTVERFTDVPGRPLHHHCRGEGDRQLR